MITRFFTLNCSSNANTPPLSSLLREGREATVNLVFFSYNFHECYGGKTIYLFFFLTVSPLTRKDNLNECRGSRDVGTCPRGCGDLFFVWLMWGSHEIQREFTSRRTVKERGTKSYLGFVFFK